MMSLNLRLIIFNIVYEQAFGCQQSFIGCGTQDCQHWYDLGHTTSGVYHVTPCGTRFGYDVYCDMETDGGGWLVFQRRQDGSENFNRSWNAYELGFGNITREFWLGLLPLRRILSKGEYELRVDLEDFEGEVRYAKYSGFSIGISASSYTLEAVGYSGDAGDSLAPHNNRPFSTYDKENDMHATLNCAEYLGGAWWFNTCMTAHLNGQYHCCGNDTIHGIVWKEWRRNGTRSDYSLKKSEMKIRRL